MSSDIKEYDNKAFKQFVHDMVKAGFEEKLQHYHGRFFYEGPAVACDIHEFQEIFRATKVSLQWDNLGLGYIVYPQRI